MLIETPVMLALWRCLRTVRMKMFGAVAAAHRHSDFFLAGSERFDGWGIAGQCFEWTEM
jgi:hypothetical protein